MAIATQSGECTFGFLFGIVLNGGPKWNATTHNGDCTGSEWTSLLSRAAVCTAIPTESASAWSVLLLCPADNSRTRRASFAGR
ncbi:hypothetical protein ACGFIW_19400 [Micromonospora sp. NPDC048935]|uniref:hypothetical protein n=1 Tax=Micromonospora sp. NPDC048935 TaxID=3364262 RepID=UPI00371CF85A